MTKLKGFLGLKIGMTRVYNAFGHVVPVTVIKAGPCTVTQIKTSANDGYDALQLGFHAKPLKRHAMPEQGHFSKAGLSNGFYHLEEFRVENPQDFELGQSLTINDLDVQQLVNVSAVTKGRGFSGTIKRHRFSQGNMGHGSKCHRQMGSTGQSASPSRVLKGKKMPGRMGGEKCTMKNLMVVDVKPEDNLILLKGGVPGPANNLVRIRFK